jgi:AcrR family transcriptional regulator
MTVRQGQSDAEPSFDGRGRPRDPTVEDRVLNASRAELADRGFEAYSVRSVARRAGVSRPSLLLRWPDRESLILETIERMVEWPRPNPSSGLREELEAIVARVVELMDPTLLGLQLRLVADAPRHPALFAAFQDKVMAKASLQLTGLLRRAVADGELPESVDINWAADALIGVVFMRTIRALGKGSLSAAAQRRIVTSMLTTLRQASEDAL